MFYTVINQLLTLYGYIVIVRAVMSWFAPRYDNQFYRILINLTEPVLSQIRKIVPNIGGVDISPIVLFFLIVLIKTYLPRLLFSAPTVMF